MKIVTKSEFYLLPEGTLYSHYEPCIFTGLMVKGQTLYYDGDPGDFTYQELIGNIECEGSDDFADKLDDALENKTNLSLDFDCYGRDAMYDDEQLYAVYTSEDIQGLIDCLSKSLIQIENKKPDQ